VDFAKPTYPQPMLSQRNRDGIIGATISTDSNFFPPRDSTVNHQPGISGRLALLPETVCEVVQKGLTSL
jgi:hypothetical protein